MFYTILDAAKARLSKSIHWGRELGGFGLNQQKLIVKGFSFEIATGLSDKNAEYIGQSLDARMSTRMWSGDSRAIRSSVATIENAIKLLKGGSLGSEGFPAMMRAKGISPGRQLY